MPWFMLGPAYAERRKREPFKTALSSAGLPVCEVEITEPKEMTGIAFPGEYKDKILDVFGIKSEQLTEYETDKEGVILLAGASGPSVIVCGWKGSSQEAFAGFAEEILLPVIDGNVVIHVPDGDQADVVDDNNLHIFIYSSPVDIRNVEVPQNIWGIETDHPRRAFSPSGLGNAIVDKESGYAVAEFVNGNNLFIHHNIVSSAYGGDRLAIFRKLCLKVRAMVIRKKHVSAEKIAARQKAMIDRSRSLYADICFEETDTFNEGKTAEDRAKFESEFDTLLNSGNIKNVLVSRNIIRVYTRQIDATLDDQLFDIGEFRIDIRLGKTDSCEDEESDEISFFNLTRSVGSSAHPHVDSSGEACFGNVEDYVNSLLNDRQFPVLVMMLIVYLKSVNPSLDISDMDGWPLVRRKKRGGKHETKH